MNYSLNKTKYLSDEELTYLNSLIVRYSCRDTALINLALHTGARANELLSITPADLDDKSRSVFIRGSKGSKDREIPLPDSLYYEVKGYIPFNISYRRLAQIWDDYRPGHKKFHSLRHTFAINLYRRTKDIKLVQICLGHKSITSTQVYSDFVYEQQELRRLVIDFHTPAQVINTR